MGEYLLSYYLIYGFLFLRLKKDFGSSKQECYFR